MCSHAARSGVPQAPRPCVTERCVRVGGAGGRPVGSSLREQRPLGSATEAGGGRGQRNVLQIYLVHFKSFTGFSFLH